MMKLDFRGVGIEDCNGILTIAAVIRAVGEVVVVVLGKDQVLRSAGVARA